MADIGAVFNRQSTIIHTALAGPAADFLNVRPGKDCLYILSQGLGDFIDVYNYARRLKTLKGPTPFEYVCKVWTNEPARFIFNPTHQSPGLNI